MAATDSLPSKTSLKEIMSPTIYSVPSDTSINEALKTMAKHHIRRLLVTEEGKPIGMVSQRSILGGTFRIAKDPVHVEPDQSHGFA